MVAIVIASQGGGWTSQANQYDFFKVRLLGSVSACLLASDEASNDDDASLALVGRPASHLCLPQKKFGSSREKTIAKPVRDCKTRELIDPRD